MSKLEATSLLRNTPGLGAPLMVRKFSILLPFNHHLILYLSFPPLTGCHDWFLPCFLHPIMLCSLPSTSFHFISCCWTWAARKGEKDEPCPTSFLLQQGSISVAQHKEGMERGESGGHVYIYVHIHTYIRTYTESIKVLSYYYVSSRTTEQASPPLCAWPSLSWWRWIVVRANA